MQAAYSDGWYLQFTPRIPTFPAVFLINLMLFRFGNTTSKNLFAGFLDVYVPL